MTTTTRLHYSYAMLAGQLLVAVALGLVVLGALLTSHYGDATTLNQGYSVGSETGVLELGYETVGNPGPFGHIKTPWGVLSYYGGDNDPTWCPTGSSDVDCGA